MLNDFIHVHHFSWVIGLFIDDIFTAFYSICLRAELSLHLFHPTVYIVAAGCEGAKRDIVLEQIT